MRRNFLFLSTVVSAFVLSFASSQAFADDRHPDLPDGGQKCYPGNPDCPNRIESVSNANDYGTSAKKLKMNSIEKFQGTVKSVNRERYPNGRLFIQVILDTNEGQKTILVGPASYVDKSKVKLQVGDKVTIKGYRVGANGKEVIMAQEINKNGNILQLLDEQRQPLWGNGNGSGYNGNNSQKMNGY